MFIAGRHEAFRIPFSFHVEDLRVSGVVREGGAPVG